MIPSSSSCKAVARITSSKALDTTSSSESVEPGAEQVRFLWNNFLFLAALPPCSLSWLLDLLLTDQEIKKLVDKYRAKREEEGLDPIGYMF